MPLIRVSRDKRGIDTLYLLHQRSDGRGDLRLRVLYFCAAPQSLVFGRPWLDPATQRALEQRYPDVAFDWPALLRDVEQRRLPATVEPPLRRGRGHVKADRRPPASEVPADRTESPKRKRRRGGEPGERTSPRPGAPPAGATDSPPGETTSIIEP